MSNTSGSPKRAKVDLFISKERQARVWMLAAVVSVNRFTWARQTQGLKESGDMVLTAGHGQIIQAGVFDGRAFSKSKPVTVYFQLGLNREMASNSRYPEFVMKFDIHEGED